MSSACPFDIQPAKLARPSRDDIHPGPSSAALTASQASFLLTVVPSVASSSPAGKDRLLDVACVRRLPLDRRVAGVHHKLSSLLIFPLRSATALLLAVKLKTAPRNQSGVLVGSAQRSRSKLIAAHQLALRPGRLSSHTLCIPLLPYTHLALHQLI